MAARVCHDQVPDGAKEPALEFIVDPEAEPGNVLAALARLLLALAERQSTQGDTPDGEAPANR